MINRIAIAVVLTSLSLITSAQKGQTKQYAVVARFISYGAGVPNNKPVMNFTSSFEKKYKTKKIKIDTLGPRGREGEYGLGFLLQELSKKQKKSFIQQIKKITKQTGDRGEIQYEENVALEDVDIPRAGKTNDDKDRIKTIRTIIAFAYLQIVLILHDLKHYSEPSDSHSEPSKNETQFQILNEYETESHIYIAN